MELQVHDLHKSFDGREVLHGISFSISSGKALGLLGRNGAGKSTTIRILMDVFKADQGNMSMNGKTFHAKDYNIGYLPEERGLYPKKKVSEQLIYLATLRGLSHGEAKANLKKVQLAQTLMCDPDIVILDEPFSGLDPVNSQTLKEVVQEQIQDGKLVIFSSHQMNYVEEFCEDIVILHHGDVVLQGNLKQIKKEYGKNRIVIRALYPKKQEFRELLETQCQELLHIYEEKDGGFIIELQPNVNKRDVLTRMLELEVDLEAFQLYEASLTDIFVSKAGDEE